MDNEPRDDQWWIPWHWTGRQWRTVIVVCGALTVVSWFILLTATNTIVFIE